MGAQRTRIQPARTLVRALAIALMVQGISGCFYRQPPNRAFHARVSTGVPDAPVDGHRQKHQDGPDLVYDSRLGVYVVLGHPNHFHDGHRYFRSRDGRWQRSTHLHGKWVTISIREVPRGLVARAARRRTDHEPPAKHEH